LKDRWPKGQKYPIFQLSDSCGSVEVVSIAMYWRDLIDASDERVPILEFLEQHLQWLMVYRFAECNFSAEFLEEIAVDVVRLTGASPGYKMSGPVTQKSEDVKMSDDKMETKDDMETIDTMETTDAMEPTDKIDTTDRDGDEIVVAQVPATTTAGNPPRRQRKKRAAQQKKTKMTNGQRGPPRRSTCSPPRPAARRRCADVPKKKTAEADHERDQPSWQHASLHQQSRHDSPGGVWGEQREGVWTMRARRPRRPGDSSTHVGRLFLFEVDALIFLCLRFFFSVCLMTAPAGAKRKTTAMKFAERWGRTMHGIERGAHSTTQDAWYGERSA
jgi:hypothetical protein